MATKLVTLAIHTPEKANVLKKILEENGIDVHFELVNNEDTSGGIALKIDKTKLTKALTITWEHNLFSYADKQTYKIDDGRKRILVAVDFSDYSLKACRAAFMVADKLNAKVKILNVFSYISYPTSLPFADMLKEEQDEGMLDKARKQMLDLCFEIDNLISKGELPSINYSYSLREGFAVEEIDDFIEEYKPFLLVVGVKGKDNNETYVLGNVTADIIEITNVPVLAISANAKLTAPLPTANIAFMTNLHKRDLQSFNTLVKMLKSYPDVKVTLLHINQVDKKRNKMTETELLGMKEHFKKEYPNLNVQYELVESSDSDMVNALIEYIDETAINVVALSTRKRNLFGRMFMPSISRKVLDKADVSLLILRG